MRRCARCHQEMDMTWQAIYDDNRPYHPYCHRAMMLERIKRAVER